MPTSKILIDGVGIDLSGSTLSAGSMLDGTTGLDANGNQVTGNIQMQAAQTITPGLTAQTIASGKYLSGNQTIAAITKELLASLDADFAAENIKKNVDLFGLVGTLESGGGIPGLEGQNVKSGSFTLANDLESYMHIHADGILENTSWTVFMFPLGVYTRLDESLGDKAIIGSISKRLYTTNNNTFETAVAFGQYASIKPMNNRGLSKGYKSNSLYLNLSSDCKVYAGVTYHWIAIEDK